MTTTSGCAKLDAVPAVDIDTGRFKYVLIRVDSPAKDASEERSKTIVRGYKWGAFHGTLTTFVFVYLFVLFLYLRVHQTW